MIVKVLFVLCVSALSIQTITAQCAGYNGGVSLPNDFARAELAGAALAGAELAGARLAGAEFAGARLAGTGYGFGAPYGTPAAIAPPPAFAATNGGGFTVTCTSPITPTGITVLSDNTIEGPMEVFGQLPILATVGVEGQIPTNGAAGTTYSCGNGQVGFTSDSLAAAGLGAGLTGAGLASNLARAELAGAQLTGAEIAAANRLRSRGAIY